MRRSVGIACRKIKNGVNCKPLVEREEKIESFMFLVRSGRYEIEVRSALDITGINWSEDVIVF